MTRVHCDTGPPAWAAGGPMINPAFTLESSDLLVDGGYTPV
jgi:hypothetical protein